MIAITLILSLMVMIATAQETQETYDHDVSDRSLSGIVVDAETQEAIPNATVHLKHAEGTFEGVFDADDEATSILETATTNESGEFTFENVTMADPDNESYVIEVEAPGYEREEKDVDLDEYLGRDMDQDWDQDQDWEAGEDKHKEKIRIELKRENGDEY